MKIRHSYNILSLLLCLGIMPFSGCQIIETGKTEPCLQGSYLKLRALPIGASMTMEIGMGQIMGSDCLNDSEAAKGWTWVTSDRTIAIVTPTGIVTGIKPGTFSLKATKGNQTLEAKGFIMPKDWTVEFEPPAATVKVGESVKLKVVAYDINHKKLPPVPFSVYTPEFFQQAKEPLVGPWSQQQETDSAVFRANQPGVTQMIGKIEDKQVKMKLTIAP